MAEFIEVPLEIIHDILSRVPAKYLLRLRCVCKAWKNIIDDQSFFVKSHIKKQQSSSSSTILMRRNKEEDGALVCLSLDSLSHGEELDIIPLDQIILPGVPRLSHLPALSCNGLILIPHDNITGRWALWNPLLQHFHLLPPPPPPEATDLKKSDKYETFLARFGFGYDEGSDDYKVVRVDHFYRRKVNDYLYREVNNYYYRTRVYSLKSGSWRTIDDFPGGDCLGDHGAFLNGTLYWRSRDGVVALDLGTEVHRLVAPPPPSSNINTNKEEMCWEGLDALDGCLIWSRGGTEAWVMEEDYSWRELYSDGDEKIIVGYLKSKGQVFFKDCGDGLRWLDIENKSWRGEIRISSIFCSSNSTYIPTFALSFTQITPMSLVRLDNRYENTSGVKREWKKVYTPPKKKTRARKVCGGGLASVYRCRVTHFGHGREEGI